MAWSALGSAENNWLFCLPFFPAGRNEKDKLSPSQALLGATLTGSNWQLTERGPVPLCVYRICVSLTPATSGSSSLIPPSAAHPPPGRSLLPSLQQLSSLS